MAIDTETLRSPGWWLVRLEAKLKERNAGTWSEIVGRSHLETAALTPVRARSGGRKREGRPGLNLLDDYLRGDPPIPAVSEDWKDAVRPFLRLARMNYAAMAVEAVRPRMVVLGYTTTAEDDADGDQVAARIARANELDLRMADVFGHMLSFGDGYTILGKDRDSEDDDPPVITAEDPREVITAENPQTGRTIAALKLFCDEWDDATEIAYVYLPGVVWRATRGKSKTADGWVWDTDTPQPWPAGMEKLLPVYRFRNHRGVGEFEAHLDVLDRINDGIFTRTVMAKFQAFRQRAVKNLPERDKQGREIDYSDMFFSDPGSLWKVPDNVDFWESQPVDLGPIRLATKDDVEAFAAVTSTPMYFITPDAAAGSAEGASTQREALNYRTDDRRRRTNSPQARQMSDAFRMMGDNARANDVLGIRVLWQPAERFSLQARADAALKLKDILPKATNRRDILQYPPDQLAAMDREDADDLRHDAEKAALLAGAGAASPSPPTTDTATPPVDLTKPPAA